jgi:hypothetical protein
MSLQTLAGRELLGGDDYPEDVNLQTENENYISTQKLGAGNVEPVGVDLE